MTIMQSRDRIENAKLSADTCYENETSSRHHKKTFLIPCHTENVMVDVMSIILEVHAASRNHMTQSKKRFSSTVEHV